jgi:hypothetical protein
MMGLDHRFGHSRRTRPFSDHGSPEHPMGDNASKSRSAATPHPIAYSRWFIAVLFPNTRFFMAVARTMINAK